MLARVTWDTALVVIGRAEMKRDMARGEISCSDKAYPSVLMDRLLSGEPEL